MSPTKITSIDLYVISIDGNDEKAYLTEGEANAYIQFTREVRPDWVVTVERRTATIGGVL